MSTAGTGHNHALQLAGGTEGVVVRAASEFERLAIARSRHGRAKPIPPAHRSAAADRASEHSERPPAPKTK